MRCRTCKRKKHVASKCPGHSETILQRNFLSPQPPTHTHISQELWRRTFHNLRIVQIANRRQTYLNTPLIVILDSKWKMEFFCRCRVWGNHWFHRYRNNIETKSYRKPNNTWDVWWTATKSRANSAAHASCAVYHQRSHIAHNALCHCLLQAPTILGIEQLRARDPHVSWTQVTLSFHSPKMPATLLAGNESLSSTSLQCRTNQKNMQNLQICLKRRRQLCYPNPPNRARDCTTSLNAEAQIPAETAFHFYLQISYFQGIN